MKKIRLKVDIDFIEKLKNQDDNAVSKLRNFCYHYLSNKFYHDFEDEGIVNEAVLNILKGINKKLFDLKKGKGNLEENFKKYVTRVCRNTFLNWLKKTKREILFEDLTKAFGIDGENISPEDSVDNLLYLAAGEIKANENNPLLRLAYRDVFNAIHSLKSTKKIMAIFLKYYFGYDIKIVAEKLGISEADANITIYRARKEIVKLFKAKGIDSKYFEEFKFENLYSHYYAKKKRRKKQKKGG